MITVETLPREETDTDLMSVQVTTEDGAGQCREYEISIGPTEMVDENYVMKGRRVDDDAPDEPAGGGPSSRAYEAAAKRFQAAGYEVFGHGDE